MAASSRVPAILDYLVTTLGAALSPTPVYDGFGVTNSGDTTYVQVGVQDPDSDGDAESAASRYDYAEVARGVNPKDEWPTVYVTAVCWDGNGSAKTARDGAYTLVVALEASVRADPSLGGLTLWSLLATSTLRQNQDEDGAIAKVTVSLDSRVRLR